jgi:hypothetical protein
MRLLSSDMAIQKPPPRRTIIALPASGDADAEGVLPANPRSPDRRFSEALAISIHHRQVEAELAKPHGEGVRMGCGASISLNDRIPSGMLPMKKFIGHPRWAGDDRAPVTRGERRRRANSRHLSNGSPACQSRLATRISLMIMTIVGDIPEDSRRQFSCPRQNSQSTPHSANSSASAATDILGTEPTDDPSPPRGHRVRD